MTAGKPTERCVARSNGNRELAWSADAPAAGVAESAKLAVTHASIELQ
jgi:hypothetical protein